jgi:GNAT superfamily N-acetyltransferase
VAESFLRFASDAARPAGIRLREETADDQEFLAALYASTRAEELAAVDWPPERKASFLFDQFERQRMHYRQHYPQAEWLLIESGGQPIGRLYLECTQRELRLMDIALTPGERGQGIGTALTKLVLRYAENRSLPVSLHVEPFNPAMRLYQRFGFRPLEMRGIYCFMERPAEAIS